MNESMMAEGVIWQEDHEKSQTNPNIRFREPDGRSVHFIGDKSEIISLQQQASRLGSAECWKLIYNMPKKEKPRQMVAHFYCVDKAINAGIRPSKENPIINYSLETDGKESINIHTGILDGMSGHFDTHVFPANPLQIQRIDGVHVYTNNPTEKPEERLTTLVQKEGPGACEQSFGFYKIEDSKTR
ncbi:hypothetical protein SAMN05444392_101317 [Seinonella peptonophila]|uniref:Uncharacterized protein n=2 Tax=Seinonella peptonophila TaxID=112248 RepID=A0A1M4T5L7_9BACL|nr:hypothetical protein SAMN05444392_101317 [Seinonella peptonophila]